MNKSCIRSDQQPSVSVILITLGRSKVFKECLHSLLRQNYDNYEVVIVSDNLNLKLPEDLQSKINLNVIYNGSRVGIGRARNIGVISSKGEIVAFVDDDAVPEINWLKELVACFNKDVDAVFGYVVPRTPNLPKPFKILGELYSTMVGCNMAFRKAMLLEVGLFDEKIDYGEDENEIIRRIIKHGGGVKVCRNAIVKHDFAKNYRNLFWKTYKVGEKAHQLNGENPYRKINRIGIIKNLIIKKEFLTIFIFLLLFIIRRIGILMGMIKFWINFIKGLALIIF